MRWFCQLVRVSPLTHWHSERPKQAWLFFFYIFLTIAFLSKIFEGEMFIRILPTTLLQIFCENLLYFQVIFKSMKIADDTFLGNSECEWVKLMQLVANLANTKWCEKSWKMTETLANGYWHMLVLTESFPMNTNMTGFRRFSKFLDYLSLRRK